jgi:hypothetical protein
VKRLKRERAIGRIYRHFHARLSALSGCYGISSQERSVLNTIRASAISIIGSAAHQLEIIVGSISLQHEITYSNTYALELAVAHGKTYLTGNLQTILKGQLYKNLLYLSQH